MWSPHPFGVGPFQGAGPSKSLDNAGRPTTDRLEFLTNGRLHMRIILSDDAGPETWSRAVSRLGRGVSQARRFPSSGSGRRGGEVVLRSVASIAQCAVFKAARPPAVRGGGRVEESRLAEG